MFSIYMIWILKKYKITNLSGISQWIIASIFITLLFKTCAFLITANRIGNNFQNKADSDYLKGLLLVIVPFDNYLYLIFGYVIYQMYKVFAIFKLTDNIKLM